MDTLVLIHRDDDLVCVDKPSGMLSVPGKGPLGGDCVVNRLAAKFGWAREVHRLDMDTSGLMVVALNAESHRALSRQFRDRTVGKRYEAVVHGRVEGERGEIDLPLRADIENRPRQIVDHEHGKASLTRYEVLHRDDQTTRIALAPETGRSHQLRVHLASVGHAILGDDLYAPTEVCAMSARLLLHATSLCVDHPASGKRLVLVSPCPF